MVKGEQIDLSEVLAKQLSGNRGPSGMQIGQRLPPVYSSSLQYHDGEFAAVLTFKSGEFYCCIARSCHKNVQRSQLWGSLKIHLENAGEIVPNNFVLTVTTIVEEGAMIFDFAKPIRDHKGWYEFGATEPLMYEEHFFDGVIANDK